MIAETPEPPYYAVIFTSQHTGAEKEEYEQTSARMVELAKQQPGFISFDSVRNEAGVGITTVYWKDKKSIDGWRRHPEHRKVKRRGKAIWYEKYSVRIAKVDKEYGKP